MKTPEERALYRSHVCKLGQGRVISAEDGPFWSTVWASPCTANDILELLTLADIRTIRDQNLSNFTTFIRVTIDRLCSLPKEDFVDTKLVLNCMRLLTKTLPVLFELRSEELEKRLFWSSTYDPMDFCLPYPESSPCGGSKDVLAVRLMSTILGLLFLPGFTLAASTPSALSPIASHNFWETGLGTPSSKYSKPDLVLDSNRTETLRLLLTLLAKSFYQAASKVVEQGNRFTTLLVVGMPSKDLITLELSLLNLICRSARVAADKNALLYTNSLLTEMRHLCVTYASQVLTAMVTYHIPKDPQNFEFLYRHKIVPGAAVRPVNVARAYLSKLHRENELYYIATYFMSVLRQPMEAARGSLDNSFLSLFGDITKNLTPWIAEVTALMWELFQCNDSFRALMREKFISELFLVLLYHVFTFQHSQHLRTFTSITIHFLLYLSSDISLTGQLCYPMNQQFYSTFPQNFKCSTSPITYRDAVVIQIGTLLLRETTGRGSSSRVLQGLRTEVLVTSLVEILFNVTIVVGDIDTFQQKPADSPEKKLFNVNYLGGLSYSASAMIMQLIVSFSTRPFLLEKPYHAGLLALLITAVCTAAIKHPRSSRMLLFNMLKNEKNYDVVWITMQGLRTKYFDGNELKEKETFEDTIGEEEADEEEAGAESPNTSVSNLHIHSDRSSEISVAESHILDLLLQLQQADIVVDESVFEESLRPQRPSGMSARAREKLPIESTIDKAWGGHDALRIILTILLPHMKLVLRDLWNSKPEPGAAFESFLIVQSIERVDFNDMIEEHKTQLRYDFLPNTPVETLKFKWSQVSLGWYLSLLLSNMYSTVARVKAYTGNKGKILKNLTSSISSLTKFTSSWLPFGSSNHSSASNLQLAPMGDDIETRVAIETVGNALAVVNHWADTNITVFKIQKMPETFLGSLNTKFNQSYSNHNSNNSNVANSNTSIAKPQSLPGTPRDISHSLHRRLSDFRFNNNNGSRTSISSIHSANGSLINTPIEEQQEYFGKRSSISSLHSLNLINRSNSATPRNSVSIEIRE